MPTPPDKEQMRREVAARLLPEKELFRQLKEHVERQRPDLIKRQGKEGKQ